MDDETRDHEDITHEEGDANAMTIAHEEADNNGVAITHPVADDNDANNEVAELQRAVPVQAALNSGCNGAIDLLQQFDENKDQKCSGYAQVYTTAQGEKLPVSAAHQYMHRDDRLWRFNAYEFGRLFNIRAMTKNDTKWYDKVTTIQPQDHVATAGRPCDRFLLQPPHPLHTSHILVPRLKLGIPAFAGAPPPSDPSSPLMDCNAHPAMIQKRKRFAEFDVANFTPWSATRPPDLCYET